MSDLFLDEVKRVWLARRELKTLGDAASAALARSLASVDDWIFCARDGQLPPENLDWAWLFMGGRGTGKTHAMSAAVHMAIRAGIMRINFIAPTTTDFHDTNVEGASGILATCGRDPRPNWAPSRKRLEWKNGALCVFFSADEPESLRGPQCELCIIDEIARMRYQQFVFDNARLGCRLGDKPRMLFATTPQPTKFMKRLVAMSGVSITTGSTYDNAAHLSPDYLKRVREAYEGGRYGLQELQGVMILKPQDALFEDEWIILDDVPDDLIEQVTVGVDPPGRPDTECGIVVSALLTDKRLAVLADRSTTGKPGHWGEEAVRAHDAYDADDIVIETNFGGQMVVDVVKGAADRLHAAGERDSNMIRVKEVTASRGKVMRAEPISLLYEKGRVVHRRGLDRLEGEMLQFSRDWDRAKDGSPNRLDAAVWGLTRLSKIKTDIPIA